MGLVLVYEDCWWRDSLTLLSVKTIKTKIGKLNESGRNAKTQNGKHKRKRKCKCKRKQKTQMKKSKT